MKTEVYNDAFLCFVIFMFSVLTCQLDILLNAFACCLQLSYAIRSFGVHVFKTVVVKFL